MELGILWIDIPKTPYYNTDDNIPWISLDGFYRIQRLIVKIMQKGQANLFDRHYLELV